MERAGLAEKALVDGVYYISKLNQKERVSLLTFMGQSIDPSEPFDSLSCTARALRKSTASARELSTISSPSDIPFPVVETRDLFVRETYKDLHDEITSTFSDGPVTFQNRLVVTGTSGIGKSAFLIYFAIRLLAESDDDSPPIIIFHTKWSSECYVYGGVSTVRYGEIDDFRPLLNLPETWHLVDSSPEPLLGRAKTVISVSPKTLASATSPYKEVTKETPRIYYMAPWEQDGLEECRSSVREFNMVSQDLMRKLYTKIGGVPRYVLKSPMITLTRKPGNFAAAELGAFSRVKEAIGYIKDPSALLQCAAQGEEPLLHRWPTDDRRKYHLEWASTYIKEELVKQMRDQAWGILLKNLVLGGRQIAGGPLFELYVLHIFRKGGITFETKELGEAANPDLLPIQVSPPVEFFRKSEELLGLPESSEGSLFIPTIPNFPCVDLVMAPDKLFQITVSSEHPIKQAPLISIAESILGKNWSEGRKKLGLYFVVPSTIYADFKVQSYSTISGTTCKRQHEIIRQRVKQYALKIDVEAAIAGRSPGSSSSVGNRA